MKLDLDLIREMLLQVEEDADGHKNIDFVLFCKERFPNQKKEITEYHMKYLYDAGFIQGGDWFFIDISPYGRNFLNNIRDNGIWTKTKIAIKPFGTVAHNVIVDIASSIIRKTFNLP